MVDAPLGVADGMVGPLKRIRAKVVELGKTQRDERLLPDIEALCALLSEDDLPIVVTQRDERAVVVEVEELVARARALCRRARR